MKIVLYPADQGGCGHFRMIWPAEALQRQSHDVTLVDSRARQLKFKMDGERVADIIDPPDADVIVFQRVTHRWVAQAVGLLREKGYTTVVDIDDDLGRIHPRNPAFDAMHPRYEMRPGDNGQPRRHSWANLVTACRNATLVTTSTPQLLNVYAKHGRGHVLYNYLPEFYFGIERKDSDVIGWPAAIQSHPDDPTPVGGAVARLVGAGASFRVVSDPTGAGIAFGLSEDPEGASCSPQEWPHEVAKIGVGLAPLADTEFNRSKSWLKPLEMSALGVPWVASPRVEYERLHRLGCGALADRPRAWYRELSRLHGSAQAREELSLAGRSAVDGHRIEQQAWRWLEAWEHAVQLQATTGTGIMSGAV